jgi:hypothetical protein
MLVTDPIRLSGKIIVELRDASGNLKVGFEAPNLITTTGEIAYASAYASMSGGVAAPATVWGMQLGTSNTAPNQDFNPGASIVSYISGSNQPILPAWTSIVTGSGLTALRWKTVWAAGEATSTTIREVAMVTTSINAGASISDTIARSVFPTTLDKWATDTLTVVWVHQFSAT